MDDTDLLYLDDSDMAKLKALDHSMNIKRNLTLTISMLVLCPVLYAQFAEEMIDRNLKARGDVDSLKGILSMRMEGTVSLPGGSRGRFVLLKKRPNKVRVEMATPEGTVVQVFDGETAWTQKAGSSQIQKLSENQSRDLMEYSDFDGPLVNYNQKGYVVEYAGSDTVNGVPTEKLKLTRRLEVRYLYLDPASGLEVQTSSRNLETQFGDYREVSGVRVPFSINRKGGERATYTVAIEKIEIDVAIDELLFTMAGPFAPAQEVDERAASTPTLPPPTLDAPSRAPESSPPPVPEKGPPSTPLEVDRFSQAGADVAKDRQTGLVWGKVSERSSIEAGYLCFEIRLGGFSDWRSPAPSDFMASALFLAGEPTDVLFCVRGERPIPPAPVSSTAESPESETGFPPVYFDYNRYDLRPDQMHKIEQVVEMLKSRPEVKIIIEGHCDDRGTDEYNLSLGDSRAKVVKQYLIEFGISYKRMLTVSYGESNPIGYGKDETVWSQNRRAQIRKDIPFPATSISKAGREETTDFDRMHAGPISTPQNPESTVSPTVTTSIDVPKALDDESGIARVAADSFLELIDQGRFSIAYHLLFSLRMKGKYTEEQFTVLYNQKLVERLGPPEERILMKQSPGETIPAADFTGEFYTMIYQTKYRTGKTTDTIYVCKEIDGSWKVIAAYFAATQ